MKCGLCEENPIHVKPNPNMEFGICKECLYKSNVSINEIPRGAIYCFNCKGYSGFVLNFAGGLKVGYAYTGNDDKKHPIYTVVAVNGSWNKRLKPTSCNCVTCDSTSSIPIWMLRYNKYVRQSIEESSRSNSTGI